MKPKRGKNFRSTPAGGQLVGLHKQSLPTQAKDSVRAGGLRLCSRDFQSSGLKLTPMGIAVPLPLVLQTIEIRYSSPRRRALFV